MWPNPQEIVKIFNYISTEEILNGKLHFLCSAGITRKSVIVEKCPLEKFFMSRFPIK